MYLPPFWPMQPATYEKNRSFAQLATEMSYLLKHAEGSTLAITKYDSELYTMIITSPTL